MVVVSVVVLLMSIAVPSFVDFIQRTKLHSATSGLSVFRSVIEQSYQDNRSYRTDDESACRIANFEADHFTLSCAATSDTAYTLTATSKSNEGLGAVGDYVFTIDQDGTEKTTAFKGTTVDFNGWLYK